MKVHKTHARNSKHLVEVCVDCTRDPSLCYYNQEATFPNSKVRLEILVHCLTSTAIGENNVSISILVCKSMHVKVCRPGVFCYFYYLTCVLAQLYCVLLLKGMRK